LWGAIVFEYPPALTVALPCLLNLAPEIRERIMALPPAAGWGPITERRIRLLARIQDRAAQIEGFEALMRQGGP
jgi:hypothetical protein